MSKRVYIPIDVPDKVALRKLKENNCQGCPFSHSRTSYDSKIRRSHAEFMRPLFVRHYPDLDGDYINKVLDCYVAGLIEGPSVLDVLNNAREVRSIQQKFL